MESRTTPPDVVYAFIDTTVFLSCTTFDEVDWAQALDALAAHLVLVPTVVGELDRHKDNHRDAWRQNRAALIIRKLGALLAGVNRSCAEIRQGACIEFVDNRTMIPWENLPLERDVHDDQILAAALQYHHDNPDLQIVLLTADLGMRLKAQGVGVSALDPSDQIGVVRPTSEEAKLRAKLQALESRRPNVRLRFDGEQSSSALLVVSPEIRPSTDWSEARHNSKNAVEAIEEKLAERRQSAPSDTPEDDIKRFEILGRDYVRYCEEYHFRRDLAEHGNRIALRLALENQGSAPATDVTLTLSAPENCTLVEQSDMAFGKDGTLWLPYAYPGQPIPSVTIMPPWERAIIKERVVPSSVHLPYMSLSLPNTTHDRLSEIAAQTRPKPEFSSAQYDSEETRFSSGIVKWTRVGFNKVSYHCMKLRQRKSWLLEDLVLLLPREHSGAVRLCYELLYDEMLDKPVTRAIVVRIKQPG